MHGCFSSLLLPGAATMQANGAIVEIEPLCVLDFYVYEEYQRQGVGKALFEVSNAAMTRVLYDWVQQLQWVRAYCTNLVCNAAVMQSSNRQIIMPDCCCRPAQRCHLLLTDHGCLLLLFNYRICWQQNRLSQNSWRMTGPAPNCSPSSRSTTPFAALCLKTTTL